MSGRGLAVVGGSVEQGCPVPDVPLFTMIANEVPDTGRGGDRDATGDRSLTTAAKCCSLRREARRADRKAHRQGSQRLQHQSATLQQQYNQNQLTQAQVHSAVDQAASKPQHPALLFDTSVQCRHSKRSRRWLSAELEKLRKENESLRKGVGGSEGTDTMAELQTRVAQLENERERILRTSAVDAENAGSLKDRNKELAQDVFMLKNLVIRLNVELERAQDRLRSIKADDGGLVDLGMTENIGDSEKGRLPTWGRSEMNAVAPLLQAYQETLEDRDQLIHSYRREMDRFAGRCKSVIAENDGLHQQLVEAKKKSETMRSEWEAMQREAAMTKEQNELLMRQSKLNQSKVHDIQNAYQTRVMEVGLEKEQLDERLQKTQTELYVLRGRFGVLAEECERMKAEANNKIPVTVHKAAVEECKRLFEELKHRYENERENLTRKLATLEASRPDVDIQLVNVTAERDQLAVDNKSAGKMNKKLEEKFAQSEARLKQSERARESCKRQLGQAMAFARELIAEQEALLSQLTDKHTASRIGTDIAARIGHLQSKLKGVERGACRELEGMEQRFKEHASGVDRMKEHFGAEIARMKTLLREKDALIQQLKQEKCKTEDQLEVVWKAATAADDLRPPKDEAPVPKFDTSGYRSHDGKR